MEKDPDLGSCFYCGKAGHPCPHCSAVSCSSHLAIHKPRETCLPFTVITVEGKGRVAVATTTLKPGEVVLEDSAVSLVPEWKAGLCLVCLRPTDTQCEECRLRLCCPGDGHREECQLLRQVQGQQGQRIDLVLALIRLQKGERREEVELLMDHLEERKALGTWESVLAAVVQPLAACQPSLGSRDQLERQLGVFLTNCVDAGPGTVGLFPSFSLLSHSCLANTRRCTEGSRLTVRAATRLEEGQELLTSYKNPEVGSVARRNHFPATWFFDCTCMRCSSPTELGSHLSSLCCPSPPCPGFLLPSHPLEYNSPWTCQDCSTTLSSTQAMDLQVSMFRAVSSLANWTVDYLETLLPGLLKTCHPAHFLVLQVKKGLVSLIENNSDTPVEQLAYKVSLCGEWLEAMGKVDPGYSVSRGKMLEELAGAKMQVLRRVEGSKVHMLLGVKEVMGLLREAMKCNQFDRSEEQEAFARRMEEMMQA